MLYGEVDFYHATSHWNRISQAADLIVKEVSATGLTDAGSKRILRGEGGFRLEDVCKYE
jgi:hypothetical protein